MRKNGGSGPIMRSWRCELCYKHVTWQNIPLVLEEQFGPEWREWIPADTSTDSSTRPSLTGPIPMGTPPKGAIYPNAQEETGVMITVPQRLSNEMVSKVDALVTEQ